MITSFPRLGVPSSAGNSQIVWDVPFAWGSGGATPLVWNIVRRSTTLHLLLNTIPAGDGSLSLAERQDIAHCYAGILSGVRPAFPRRTVNMMILLNTPPAGDLTIDQADRQDVAWHYGGILAGSAPTGSSKLIPEDFFDTSVL